MLQTNNTDTNRTNNSVIVAATCCEMLADISPKSTGVRWLVLYQLLTHKFTLCHQVLINSFIHSFIQIIINNKPSNNVICGNFCCISVQIWWGTIDFGRPILSAIRQQKQIGHLCKTTWQNRWFLECCTCDWLMACVGNFWRHGDPVLAWTN